MKIFLQGGGIKIKSGGSFNQFDCDQLYLISWRKFLKTMINRSDPNALPEADLTPPEIQLLDHLVMKKNTHPEAVNLSSYDVKIAMLGDYLARNNDPPLGNLVIWRGLHRLADIALGVSMKEKLVGNW
jgi:hypothetical protein